MGPHFFSQVEYADGPYRGTLFIESRLVAHGSIVATCIEQEAPMELSRICSYAINR